jgi:hypothetical protein
MDCHHRHKEHAHVHGPNCGHKSVQHGSHTAYLHDGHMHVGHEDHYDCVAIEITAFNPDACTPQHSCKGHEAQHKHGPDCGHEQVPHGSHVDYLVDGHLHHTHDDHCDDHGHIAT